MCNEREHICLLQRNNRILDLYLDEYTKGNYLKIKTRTVIAKTKLQNSMIQIRSSR